MNLSPFIEHTNLKPEATGADIRRLCEEAARHNFRGVCVTGWHIQLASQILKGSNVLPIAVVGFPLGCSTFEVVGYETLCAVHNGAKEIDMVLNTGAVLSQNDAAAGAVVSEVVRLARSEGAAVKVILESWRFTDMQDLQRACRIAVDNGANFLKTSTGFYGTQCAATPEQVNFLRRNAPDIVRIKASGGVSTRERAIALIDAGADTLGTSNGVALMVT